MGFLQGRAFKKLLAWLLVIALPLLGLQGCGGGGAPSPPSVPTQEAEGTVNQTELGGDGLKVVSAYQDEAPVDKNGSFQTTVSSNGVQLLFLLDQNNQLRGLSLSIPQTKGTRQTNVIPFSVESTVLSILFIAPGIFHPLPTEAQVRINEIKNLPSFSDAVNFLHQNINEKPLQDILEDETFNQKLLKCIEDWLEIHPITTKSRDITPGAPKGGFYVKVEDQSNPSNVSLTLENWAWRYVNVARRDLDPDEEELKVQYIADGINSMAGGIPASVGAVFTGTLGDPTRRKDNVNFTSPAIGKVEYWVIGPGKSSGSDTLPSSIKTSSVDAWGLSIVSYCLAPLLGAFLGNINEKAKEIWQILSTSSDIRELINQAMNPDDLASLMRALINVMYKILSVFIEQILLTLGISSLNLVIAAPQIGSCISNVAIAAINWFNLPQVAKVEVHAKSGADVVVK
ncbi:hypothetical protein H5T88_10375 [bacterium]|nr:hypothetical protein [bacterium]